MVGTGGFEPPASCVSSKRSPPELRAPTPSTDDGLGILSDGYLYPKARNCQGKTPSQSLESSRESRAGRAETCRFFTLPRLRSPPSALAPPLSALRSRLSALGSPPSALGSPLSALGSRPSVRTSPAASAGPRPGPRRTAAPGSPGFPRSGFPETAERQRCTPGPSRYTASVPPPAGSRSPPVRP